MKHQDLWQEARKLKLGNKFLENLDTLLTSLENQDKQCIIQSVRGSFSANKDYDKLFKDLYKEDKREGSVYPSLYNPEAVYHNGEWLDYR